MAEAVWEKEASEGRQHLVGCLGCGEWAPSCPQGSRSSHCPFLTVFRQILPLLYILGLALLPRQYSKERAALAAQATPPDDHDQATSADDQNQTKGLVR